MANGAHDYDSYGSTRPMATRADTARQVKDLCPVRATPYGFQRRSVASTDSVGEGVVLPNGSVDFYSTLFASLSSLRAAAVFS